MLTAVYKTSLDRTTRQRIARSSLERFTKFSHWKIV
jgi:hypothetical protein